MRTYTPAQLGFDPRKLGPNSPLRNAALPRAPKNDGEHHEQARLFAWALEHEATYPDLRWLFAVPNFAGRLGKKTAIHGARLKREGRKPGVLDVWFPVRRGPYVGLVIEMKYGRNRLTAEQIVWRDHLLTQGWHVHTCYAFEAARTALQDYLDLPRP